MSITLLSEGKTIRIKAHGYSMYPSIKPGSLILIEPLIIKGKPLPGEIVAIKRESGIVVHRIVKTMFKNNTTYYIARGDSNAYPDNPVTVDKIAGRVVKSEPTGENPVPADIRINTKPSYFYNRIRVIAIFIMQKVRKLLK
ncbi:MAG: signal peptidase I [Odoribacter sp.]|nr:signal peptidase I [Odoribacter sp.]